MDGGAAERGPEEGPTKIDTGTRPFFVGGVCFDGWEGAVGFLMYSVANELPGLRMSLPRVKEERDRRPRWLGDYSYSNINNKTLAIAAFSAK